MEKQELLKKVQELADGENLKEAYSEIKKFARNFRSNDDTSLYDQELNDKFDKIMHDVAEKLGDVNTDIKAKKEEIIAQAKELLDSKQVKAASNKMKELFDDWKMAGHLDRESDDALWNEFQEIRNTFYTKKQEYYDNLIKSFEENKGKKEELIAKAKEALDNADIPSVNKAMNELMDAWKKVGHAGKEAEDALWKEFSGLRKEFFKKRDSYYEQMKEVYAKRVVEKEELIAKAKINLARSEFTAEEKADMDALKAKWKEIGSAGKDNENKLWEQFNAIIKKYIDNSKLYK